MRDKGLHMRRCSDPRQGYFDRNADQHKRTELLELARAGTDIPHSAEVESEVVRFVPWSEIQKGPPTGWELPQGFTRLESLRSCEPREDSGC
jgi:hypothetical protein